MLLNLLSNVIKSRAILESTLQNTAYKKAMSDDPKNNNILMFVLKTQFRWQETARFKIDPNADPIGQLKSLLQQASAGGLTIDAAAKAASLIETTEKASKGNLGEVMPSVVVTQYDANDFEKTEMEVVENDK